MKQETKSILIVGSVLLVSLIFLIVSLNYNPISLKSRTEESAVFNSVEEIRAFLEKHSISEGITYGGIVRGREVLQEAVAMPGGTTVAGSKSSDSARAREYSLTNIQVQGVDEADIVKNDGKYIYTLSGTKLWIVEAYPAEEMKILDEIEFKYETPLNLFINDDKLIVFTQKYEYVDTGVRCDDIYWSVWRGRCGGYSKESSNVHIYDISDKNDVKLMKKISFSGNYVNSRMIGNYVYLVSTKYIQMNVFDMPFYEIDGVKKGIEPNKIRHFGQDDENFVFNTIAAIDVRNGDFNSETFLMGASTNVYVSADNIYLTYQKRLSQEYIIGKYLDTVLLPELPKNVANRIKDVWNDKEKTIMEKKRDIEYIFGCLLYTSPSPRDS